MQKRIQAVLKDKGAREALNLSVSYTIKYYYFDNIPRLKSIQFMQQFTILAGVRFPLVVYVTVDGLDLEGSGETETGGGLCASLEVLGVQDDGVHLPARHQRVPLEQLWPLRAQPNSAMHVRPTAQFIDLYRSVHHVLHFSNFQTKLIIIVTYIQKYLKGSMDQARFNIYKILFL